MKSFRQPFILLQSKSALQGDNVMFHVITKHNFAVLAWITILINPVGENISQKFLSFVIFSLPLPPVQNLPPSTDTQNQENHTNH